MLAVFHFGQSSKCGKHGWPVLSRAIRGVLLTISLTLSFCLAALAQEPNGQPIKSTPESAASFNPEETPAAAVEIDGRPIFLVHSSVGGVSPEERAAAIQERILSLAKRRGTPVDLIRVEDRGAWSQVLAGNDAIMGVTEADAKAEGRTRTQLAAENAELIRRSVTSYRQEHTWRAFLMGVVYTVVATAALIFVLLLLIRVRRAAQRALRAWVNKTDRDLPPGSFRSRMARYFVLPLLGTGVIAVMIAALALLELYATLVLRSFPSTRYTSLVIERWTVSEMSGFFKSVWNYLPNLVVLVVIGLAARYLIRLTKFIFQEIQDGKLTLGGFYPDWAAPTSKLVRLLILTATAVVAFPYLPGSNSPAFRGISVFLGVLLSLGSTSAVSHGVAGTILTYMRSFSVGDFVKIGDTIGDVVERNLLVTRICTQKKEIVTIPNGSVLGVAVVNYSAEARKGGVIFHTRVTIGYNAPWRTVHELLIAAALSTGDVLRSPSPFVLQSALDDFYVSYELNAFTAHPENMQYIYSNLHQNIQDKFNGAGIEINSPHYTSVRDGNRIAIPEDSIPREYQEPSFRLLEVKNRKEP